MALTITFEEEYLNSRNISQSAENFTETFVFYICGNFLDEAYDDPFYGPDDDLVALAAAYTVIPPYRTVPLSGGQEIDLMAFDMKVSQKSVDVWKIEVTYKVDATGDRHSGDSSPASEGDRGVWSNNYVQLGFNVSSVQENKTMSLSLLYMDGVDAPATFPYEYEKPAPIGHTIDGVEGAPAYIRAFSFSITAYFTPYQLTFAYVRQLYRLATTVNNKSFFGFPAGSARFLECSASGDLYSMIPVTFDFHMRHNFVFSVDLPESLMDPNVDVEEDMFDILSDPYFLSAPDPLKLVTGIPGNPFSGWCDVDYRYALAADETAKTMYQKPVTRMVHRNFSYGNFDLLGL